MNVNQIFPLTGKVVRNEPKSLAAVIIVYLVVCAVVKLADFLLGWVPLLGAVLSVLFWIIGLYCAVGVIVAVLEFFRDDNA